MGFFTKKTTKQYEQTIKKIKEKSITQLRKKVKILMVDDEEYDIVELLKNRGYEVYYKEDISYVLEVEPFDIIVLDIKNVAKRFGSVHEGFGFAKEVKMVYPQKLVLCYSGTSDININEQLDKIDGFVKKDTDVDIWSQKLDGCITKFSDVNHHWGVIEKQLKEQKIDTESIERLKKLYLKSFETDSFDELKSTIMDNMNNAKLFIEVISSLTSLIQIFI